MSRPSSLGASDDGSLASANTVEQLTDHVRATCPTPLDVLQIAALLETAGLNDNIARSRYAADDIFDLAQRVAGLCLADPLLVAAADPEPCARQSWQIAADDYLKGVFGVIPILLMMLVIQFLQHYGQWQPKQIIILSLSSIGSLLVTSGFVQAAARQGSSYLSQGNVQAGARFVHMVGLACLITVAASALLLAGATLATRWIGARDLPLLFVSYVTLSCPLACRRSAWCSGRDPLVWARVGCVPWTGRRGRAPIGAGLGESLAGHQRRRCVQSGCLQRRRGYHRPAQSAQQGRGLHARLRARSFRPLAAACRGPSALLRVRDYSDSLYHSQPCRGLGRADTRGNQPAERDSRKRAGPDGRSICLDPDQRFCRTHDSTILAQGGGRSGADDGSRAMALRNSVGAVRTEASGGGM